MSGQQLLRAGALWIAAVAAAAALEAGVCQVPASHATVQSALDDETCSEIQLAAGTFSEALSVLRTVAMEGVGAGTSILGGQVAILGDGTVATLSGLSVETTCDQAVVVKRWAQLAPDGFDVEPASSGPCLLSPAIFADGFESGTTRAWSGVNP